MFVEDSAFLGLRGGQSGWLLPTLATMSRGVRVLAKEVWCGVVWCRILVGLLSGQEEKVSFYLFVYELVYHICSVGAT